MSKLHIKLESLDVQSFDTLPDAIGGEGGTVFGHGTNFGDASCVVTNCADCNATADERVCPPGSTYCPSVAYCESGICDSGRGSWEEAWTARDQWTYCRGVT